MAIEGKGAPGACLGRLTKNILAVVGAAAISSPFALPSTVASAAEGAFYGGPAGGTDIRQAYTPEQSGFYGSIISLYALGTSAYGANNELLSTHVNTNLGILGGGILYVYPTHLWGGSLDSFVQQVYGYGYATIGPKSGSIYGANDTYVEFLGWSKYIGPLFGEQTPRSSDTGKPPLPYGLTMKIAYSMLLPTGAYSPTDILPQGHNDWFFIPHFALTYLTPPNAIGDGIEISAQFFADIASRNPTTDYYTGDVMDLDFAVSDRLGQYQFGLAGFYAKQIQPDNQYGAIVSPNGKELESLDLGPVIAYDIPDWHSTIKIKYQVPLEVSNSLDVQRLVVSYGFKF